MNGSELKQIQKDLGMSGPEFGEALWDKAPYTKKRKNLGVYISWYQRGKKPIPMIVQKAALELLRERTDPESEELFKKDQTKSRVMKLAWELRRHYARIWNVKVMEISWSHCLKLAWTTVKKQSQKKQAA